MKHGKNDIFLEDLNGTSVDENKEEEANRFAQKWLFPVSALKELTSRPVVTDDDIKVFAEEYETHPAIIVGQLQHIKRFKYHQGNHFKVPLSVV